MDSVERGPSRLSRGIDPIDVPEPTLEQRRELAAQALEIAGDRQLAEVIRAWGHMDSEGRDLTHQEVLLEAAAAQGRASRRTRDEEAGS